MPSRHDRPGGVSAAGSRALLENVNTIKALLALAASGVAADVIDGTEQERAAVQLGRQLGREAGVIVMSCQGQSELYRWPLDWERAVRHYAHGGARGTTVDVRRDDSRQGAA